MRRFSRDFAFSWKYSQSDQFLAQSKQANFCPGTADIARSKTALFGVKLAVRDLPDNLESTICSKYVGLKVDPERDKENFNRVAEEEKVLIRQCCKETFERFYPDE